MSRTGSELPSGTRPATQPRRWKRSDWPKPAPLAIKELELHDQRHLEAAQGWCELHAFTEADAELEKIAARLRAHPTVPEIRWQICANLEKWAGALDIASAIVKLVAEWPSGWIYRASSLTELNRHQEAYEM